MVMFVRVGLCCQTPTANNKACHLINTKTYWQRCGHVTIACRWVSRMIGFRDTDCDLSMLFVYLTADRNVQLLICTSPTVSQVLFLIGFIALTFVCRQIY